MGMIETKKKEKRCKNYLIGVKQEENSGIGVALFVKEKNMKYIKKEK